MSPKVRTIQCNVMNPAGIALAINKLTDYKDKEFQKEKSAFMKAVGRAMVRRIEERYFEVGSKNRNAEKAEISVTTDGAFGSVLVTARGYGIFFVEFGTGTKATSAFGLRYGFYPGSWSETHERTFQEWLSSGTDKPYVYDNEAADAFVRAIGRLDEIIKEAGDEVFK